jgi:predicted Abi (CAAX) family protease
MRTNSNLKNGHVFGLPTSVAGYWAVGLEAAFVGFYMLLQLLIVFGQRGGDTFFSNILLAGTVLLGAGAAIAGGLSAVFAIARRRERSILVIAAGLLGGLVVWFLAGEVLFPH